MDVPRHRVSVVDTALSYDCREDESLLAALARLGLRGIPLGCRGGGCGVCKVEIVTGRYATLPMSRGHISESDHDAGRLLACRVFPRSDVELRVLGRMQATLPMGMVAAVADG
jgi:ferredoxin